MPPEDVGGSVLRIDPDELRRGFDACDGANAWLFQGAVSILVERVLDLAFKQNQGFLPDGTLSNCEKAKQNVEQSLSRKRVARVVYVYQEPKQAWAFVQECESLEGRHNWIGNSRRPILQGKDGGECVETRSLQRPRRWTC